MHSTPASSIECSQSVSYLLAALAAFSAVLFTTPSINAIATKHNRVDLPTDRKIHTKPIVRLGGIAICGATVAVLLVWAMGGLVAVSPEAVSRFWIIILGAVGFFVIGISDDLLDLSPLLRLALQGVIASLVWLGGIQVEWFSLSSTMSASWIFFAPSSDASAFTWLSLPLTVLWLVGVVNALNWIDGLDGLASGVGGIAAAVSFLICFYTGQTMLALISVVLLGSLLGFLVFNFNPARIFMGDGGSYFVGFLLAAVSLTTHWTEGSVISSIFLPLLVLAVPVGDMALVIFSRLYRGVSPFLADQGHLHHRLMRTGLSHRLTVLFIYALSCWIGSLTLLWVGIAHSAWFVSSATAAFVAMLCRAWHISQQGVSKC